MKTGAARKIAYMALLLGVVIVLSFLEQALPPLPMLPPGVKLGLSNIITMYCLFFFGRREAFLLAALKSAFVVLMRGPVAGLLSFSGGMASIVLLAVLSLVLGARLSYIAAGILGAVAHNLGQIAVASVILGTGLVLYYFPVLLVSGVVLGTVTGTTLKVLTPVFHRSFRSVERKEDSAP